MIRQEETEILLKKYSKALNKFWRGEKKFIKSFIEESGKKFIYYKKPLENMFSIFGNYKKLIKRVKTELDSKEISLNLKKGNSFILTPGNIPLLEIEYLYFLILVSKRILWRPSRNYLKISRRLLNYLKREGLKNLKITTKNLENLKEEIYNFDNYILIGSSNTLEEFKKVIDPNKKIIEYGSKTSLSIMMNLNGLERLIKDITYFSHSGCLSPTIIFVHEKIFDQFITKLREKLKEFDSLFSKKEKLFNFYLNLSYFSETEKVGEFYLRVNQEKIIISKGILNIFKFRGIEEVLKKITPFETMIQGISIYPLEKEYVGMLKERFKHFYIKEAGNLQLIDEDFFPDGIKPLKILLN
ncbi:MAG: acyl-CoA reductase [Candidatus Hydrothermales bacterium]